MTSPVPTDDDFLRPDQWITAKEFAAILGIRVQSLYNKINTGEDLPISYKYSTMLTRFYKPDVKAWMQKHRRETNVLPTAPAPPPAASKAWLQSVKG